MTREEAIDLLDNLIGMVEDNHKSDYDMALQMAIQALEQEPCTDSVSVEAVIEWLKDKDIIKLKSQEENAIKELQQVYSVKPQPKTGHWIDHQEDRWIYAKCSECGSVRNTQTNYCPNCGARMESEVEDV